MFLFSLFLVSDIRLGSTKKHHFSESRNRKGAVDRDVKPRNMNFAQVEKRGGAINREGAFIAINTVFLIFACFEFSPVQAFLHLRLLLRLKCPHIEQIKTNRELKNTVVFVFLLIYTTIPCRESGKGDDPCVTFEVPCDICASFTDDQMNKIQHRKRYIKKQKADASNAKDDELDLLGEGNLDSFTGSNADLESAGDNLFTSPAHPQPLPFSSLSLKTPAKTVPPTPGTALQHKIETNLEKSLGNSLNIHLQQQMGSFQASMLEAFQSLREELTYKKQTEVDQTSVSASKPGTSSHTAVNLDLPPLRHRTTIQTQDMDVDYGPALPPRLGTDPHNASDQNASASEEPSKKVSDRPKNTVILAVGMKLNPGLPRINSMRNPMNLGSHLLNLKNTLIRVNIKPGPDMCHLPQRRISPL